MIEFKYIKPDTDLSKVLHESPWDAFVNGESYKVFDVYEDTPEGRIYYYHSEGGHWGSNSFWACPRKEEPSYYTLYPFDGEACSWGFSVESKNYGKSRQGDVVIEHKYFISITRNGDIFEEFPANDLLYGISKAQIRIAEYTEHPACLNNHNWKDNIIGRHVRYHGIPAVITKYCDEQACVFVAPLHDEDINRFYKDHNGSDDEYMEDYYEESKINGGIKTELLSPYIWWWS